MKKILVLLFIALGLLSFGKNSKFELFAKRWEIYHEVNFKKELCKIKLTKF